MTASTGTVNINAPALAAWPWLPAAAPPGTWWVSDVGELARVLDDGTVEDLEGFHSIAENPCARRVSPGVCVCPTVHLGQCASPNEIAP